MNNEITIPVYWLNCGNMIDRNTLPSDHPESNYNYIKNVLKLSPENYGVYKDSQLIKETKEIEKIATH